jgi:hypothetical protein
VPSRKSAGSGEGWCTCRRCMRAGRRRQRTARSGGVRGAVRLTVLHRHVGTVARRSRTCSAPRATRQSSPPSEPPECAEATPCRSSVLPTRIPTRRCETSTTTCWSGPERSGRSTPTCRRPTGPSASRTAHCRTGERTTTPPLSHDEQNAAIAAYVRWRNARIQPKVNFAVGSPICTWTSCPVKAA